MVYVQLACRWLLKVFYFFKNEVHLIKEFLCPIHTTSLVSHGIYEDLSDNEWWVSQMRMRKAWHPVTALMLGKKSLSPGRKPVVPTLFK